MIRRGHRVFLFAFVLFCLFLPTCLPIQKSSATTHEKKPGTQVSGINISPLKLQVGTTWVYIDNEYQQSSDPTSSETATYRITETVTKLEKDEENIIAWVEREKVLANSSENWLKLVPVTSQTEEFLYVLRGNQVFTSAGPVDGGDIKTAPLRLAFDLPFSSGKIWCPVTMTLNEVQNTPTAGCEYSGKRTVIAKVESQNPFGMGKNCYQLTDQFISGSFLWQYCDGVGIVEAKYDHVGTKFGYERILIDYKE